MTIIVANIALIAAAVLSVTRPWTGAAAGIVTVAILLVKMHKESTKNKANPR
jgi:hypothetical protein